MDAFLDHYAPDVRDHLDPRLSVVLSESMASMPPTFIATAGMDILRDQGEALAARLREAVVDVVARRFLNLPHGFASVLVEPHAWAACFESITVLTAGLAVRESAAA
jgi:acetyl esterase